MDIHKRSKEGQGKLRVWSNSHCGWINKIHHKYSLKTGVKLLLRLLWWVIVIVIYMNLGIFLFFFIPFPLLPLLSLSTAILTSCHFTPLIFIFLDTFSDNLTSRNVIIFYSTDIIWKIQAERKNELFYLCLASLDHSLCL